MGVANQEEFRKWKELLEASGFRSEFLEEEMFGENPMSLMRTVYLLGAVCEFFRFVRKIPAGILWRVFRPTRKELVFRRSKRAVVPVAALPFFVMRECSAE